MFRIKTQIMETRPFDILRDDWRQMQRNGMRAVGEYWHDKMLPNHFTTQAKNIYDHEPRSNKWKAIKQNLARRGKAIMGGMVDNVLTGAMMNAVKSRAVIRGFPTRCTVYMSGPGYMKSTGFSRKKLRKVTRQPNKIREMLTTTPREAEELKRVLNRVMREQLANKRRRRTTKV